jgi:hypothetical protein
MDGAMSYRYKLVMTEHGEVWDPSADIQYFDTLEAAHKAIASDREHWELEGKDDEDPADWMEWGYKLYKVPEPVEELIEESTYKYE